MFRKVLSFARAASFSEGEAGMRLNAMVLAPVYNLSMVLTSGSM